MSNLGDIEAIRDWINGRMFCKSKIDGMLLEYGEYTPYQLTIYDIPGYTVTLTGNTSGKSYTVPIVTGMVYDIFFFDEGETITINDDLDSPFTKTLSSQSDVIDLASYSDDYYIDVYQMPNKLAYIDGDTIDTTGLVIHKYAANGTDQGVLNLNDINITDKAKIRVGIISKYKLATQADELIADSNADSSWGIKTDYKNADGPSVPLLGTNVGGDSYYGSWFGIFNISDTKTKGDMHRDGGSVISAGNIFTINGIRYYIAWEGKNYNFQRCTEIYNPNGFAEIKNVQLFTPNEALSLSSVKKMLKYLEALVDGGAVTIKTRDANGKLMVCQYGIDVRYDDVAYAVDVYNNATQGSTDTFTIQEDGLYLLVLSPGCRGTLEYDLDGRTPLSRWTFDYTERLVVVILINLYANDVITMNVSNTDNGPSYQRTIYKLGNIKIPSADYVETVFHYASVDTTTEYTFPDDNNKYLAIGVAYADNQYRNDTTYIDNAEIKLEEQPGYKQANGLYYADGHNMPHMSFYGYGYGGSAIVAWKVLKEIVLAEFDFTNSWIDSVTELDLSTYSHTNGTSGPNLSRSSDGVYLPYETSNIRLPDYILPSVMDTVYKYEIELGNIFLIYNNARILCFNTGSDHTDGFVWRSASNVWGVYSRMSWYLTDKNDINYFKDHKLIIYIKPIADKNRKMKVYRDDEFIIEHDMDSLYANWGDMCIGAPDNFSFGGYLKSLKVSKVPDFPS